jgi:hypothetical protein
MASANGDLLDFSGRVVLITGAATGIGRAVAIGFASRGAKVAIGDINEEAARETLDLAARAGADVLFVRTNVSLEADVENLVGAAVERFGRLDCAFNNASIVHAPQPLPERLPDGDQRPSTRGQCVPITRSPRKTGANSFSERESDEGQTTERPQWHAEHSICGTSLRTAWGSPCAMDSTGYSYRDERRPACDGSSATGR